MKSPDREYQDVDLEEYLTKFEYAAFYLSVPFLLSIGVVGILPWVAG